MTNNLEHLLDDVIAQDKKIAQDKATKIEEENKEYKKQQLTEKQTAQKEELDKSFIDAIRYNDVDKAKEALQKGADISYLDMGFEGKNKEWDSVEYMAYTKCDSFAMASSAEMVDFLISDVMDMNNPKHREVAQEMFDRAFFRDEKSADKLIQIAKNNALSLDTTMKNVVNRSHDIVGMYNKLLKAGASQKAFDFDSLDHTYHNQKFGYWGGREGDIWNEPQSQNAAKTRNMLTEIIKSGYNYNLKESTIIKVLAYENAYEKFSPQDKKLIADLKSDNIKQIRESLIDGRLPDNVEKYMEYVPYKEESGAFFSHYKKMMYDEYGKERDIKPYTLENAELTYTKKAGLIKLIEVAPFKPKGVENIIADKFCDEFNKISRSRDPDRMYLADKFSKMNSECKETIVKKLIPILDKELSNTKITVTQDYDTHHNIKNLLAFTLKIYDSAEENDKNALRSTMLKFRTTGSNEERCQKANFYKQALNYRGVEIKKDETIKAVSSVSYTPFSALNRQIKKFGRDLKGR